MDHVLEVFCENHIWWIRIWEVQHFCLKFISQIDKLCFCSVPRSTVAIQSQSSWCKQKTDTWKESIMIKKKWKHLSLLRHNQTWKLTATILYRIFSLPVFSTYKNVILPEILLGIPTNERMGKARRMHVKYEKFIHFIMKIWGEGNTQKPQEQMAY